MYLFLVFFSSPQSDEKKKLQSRSIPATVGGSTGGKQQILNFHFATDLYIGCATTPWCGDPALSVADALLLLHFFIYLTLALAGFCSFSLVTEVSLFAKHQVLSCAGALTKWTVLRPKAAHISTGVIDKWWEWWSCWQPHKTLSSQTQWRGAEFSFASLCIHFLVDFTNLNAVYLVQAELCFYLFMQRVGLGNTQVTFLTLRKVITKNGATVNRKI